MTANPRNTNPLSGLPAEYPEALLPAIEQALEFEPHKLIVLDDDPTGTQTVHGVSVYTRFERDALKAAFLAPEKLFYILTNSRSMNEARAVALTRDIAATLASISAETGIPYRVVSRSDSTLRGHYPAEMTALTDTITADAQLLIPAFMEGGRVTIHNVHYVKTADTLTPAAQTPFAQDSSFGYSQSDLCAWVEEKTGGRVLAKHVASVSLEEIRTGGPGAVTAKLMALHDGAPCVVNAVTYRDLEVFTLGLLRAEAAGKTFTYRTAASFVRVRAGLSAQPLLTLADGIAPANKHGGLIMLGSYVPLSSAQLRVLQARYDGLISVELNVPALLDANTRNAEIQSAIQQANNALAKGKLTVVFTSRDLIKTSGQSENLDIGKQVSTGLIQVLQGINMRPRFLIAKGGITSSDLATQGLGVHKALVKGQLLPGVPVWQLGAEARFPDLTYVVFPGNVGDEDALYTAATRLR